MRQISTKYDPPFFGLVKQKGLSIMKQFLMYIVATIILVLFLTIGNNFMEASAQSNGAKSNNILDNLLSNSTTNTLPVPSSINSTHSQSKTLIRPNPSANDTIGAGLGTSNISPNQTPSNITATINSVMSPKALLSSAIDQIRNSTSKGLTNGSGTAVRSTIVFSNPEVMQLANQNIPAKDFILIYFGNSITGGNIHAKLPCDNKSQSVLELLVNNKSNPLLPINELSRPGSTCMYDVDLSNIRAGTAASIGGTNSKGPLPQLNSTKNSNNLNDTAIELFNPTAHPVVLPSTSSIAISLQLVYENGVEKGR